MSWTLASALFLLSGVPAVAVAPVDPMLITTHAQGEAPAAWHLSMRVSAPATTTDPQHVGVSLGVGRTGAYRGAFRYQPSETDVLGFMSGVLGLRLWSNDKWTIAADAEHARVWAARKLYQSGGFQFQAHDRRWVTLGVVSAMASHRRWLGVIEGVEVGAGRMVIRESVAGRVGSDQLNEAPVLVLKTAAPVGMVGVRLSRRLRWGFSGDAGLRLIGAGRSRGGVVPFAHATLDWEITRAVFTSRKYGQGRLGLTGNHATSPRAASYYQNGVGVALTISF